MKQKFYLLSFFVLLFGSIFGQTQVTLEQIQTVSQPNLLNCIDSSSYKGQTITTNGVVLMNYGAARSGNNASALRNVWLQTGAGAWSGVQVFDANAFDIDNLLAGDSIEITATVTEFGPIGGPQVETELVSVQSINVLSANRPFYHQTISAGDLNDASQTNQISSGEQYEGVFVELKNVTVDTVIYFSSNTRVALVVTDSLGNKVYVGDRFYVQKLSATGGTFMPPSIGTVYKSLKGIVMHSPNGCKLYGGRGYEIHPFDPSHYVVCNSNISANAASLSICEGESTVLYGIGGNSYTWSNGVQDGVAFTPSSTQNYEVIGTYGYGCLDTASITITVNPVPIVVANTTASEICQGSGIILTGSGANIYSWSNNIQDGVWFAPNSTQNYILQGTTLNGCYSYDTIQVIVWDSLNLSISAPLNPICLGNNTFISANPSGGSSSYNISWNPAYTNGSSIYPTTTTTYTATLYDTLASSVCGTKNASITITVNSNPEINLGADTSLCLGNSIFLDATPTLGTAPFEYYWSNAVPITTNIQNLTPSNSTSYSVVVFDSNNCQAYDTIYVNVNPLPVVPNITVNGYTLSASGTNVTWQWYLNGNAIVGANSQFYTVSQNGVYSVAVTNSLGCISDMSAPVNMTGVAIENQLYSNLKIYPMPVKNELIIGCNGLSLNDIKVTITDISGKIVFNEYIASLQGGDISLDVSKIIGGFYLLKLEDSENIFTTKILKE